VTRQTGHEETHIDQQRFLLSHEDNSVQRWVDRGTSPLPARKGYATAVVFPAVVWRFPTLYQWISHVMASSCLCDYYTSIPSMSLRRSHPGCPFHHDSVKIETADGDLPSNHESLRLCGPGHSIGLPNLERSCVQGCVL
jgi:hypothetical protein